jgi:hypothetical protein
MTAHIGTERLDNDKLNFTTKKIYLAMQVNGVATLSGLLLDRKANTTTVTRYLNLPDKQILKFAPCRFGADSELQDSIIYLYASELKLYLGLFLSTTAKYKALLSFNACDGAVQAASFMRTSQDHRVVSFALSASIFCLIFTVKSKSGVQWYHSVSKNCCQISLQSDKSNSQDDSPNKNTIEGFVTETIAHAADELCAALSVAVTKNRNLHLYRSALKTDKTDSSAKHAFIGKYKIEFETLLSTAAQPFIGSFNFDALTLVDLVLLPTFDNQLVLVYSAVTDNSVEVLVLLTSVNLENTNSEREYLARLKSSQEMSFKKKSATRAAQNTYPIASVIAPFIAHRLSFDDREQLGPDWKDTKILVSEAKVVDNKVCMMISSTSLTIQELVILDHQNITHYTIKDQTNQGIASVDSLQLWHSKSESTLHVLTQSITEEQTAVRDLYFDIDLKPPPTVLLK